MLLFNLTDPASIFLERSAPKLYRLEFAAIIKRAIKLLSLKPDQTTLLPKQQYELESMLLSVMPELFESESFEDEDTNVSVTRQFTMNRIDDDGNRFDEAEHTLKLTQHTSLAKILFDNMSSLELESNDPFQWSQYFGLLALSQINQYMLVNEEFYDSISDLPQDLAEGVEYSAVLCLMDTSEAVSFGEALHPKTLLTQALVKDKISKQAQAAIRARYSELDKLKNEFVNFYSSSTDKTNKSRLARNFFRTLSEDKQEQICHTKDIEKAKRTLLNHLNKILNTKPFSPYS